MLLKPRTRILLFYFLNHAINIFSCSSSSLPSSGSNLVNNCSDSHLVQIQASNRYWYPVLMNEPVAAIEQHPNHPWALLLLPNSNGVRFALSYVTSDGNLLYAHGQATTVTNKTGIVYLRENTPTCSFSANDPRVFRRKRMKRFTSTDKYKLYHPHTKLYVSSLRGSQVTLGMEPVPVDIILER